MNTYFLTSLACGFLTAPGFDNLPAVENVELSGRDWVGIREACETGRHQVLEVDGGHQAHNPGQDWLAHFDGRGFHTEPEAGSWTWGLQLESWGFVGAVRVVSQPMSVSAEGGRIVYRWDADLEEWYVNDSRGLEHGYTVHARPSRGGPGPLTFNLRIRGDLQPEIDRQGRGVHFLDECGAVVLTYSGLSVFDASGRALPASFTQLGERLLLEVEEQDALYPLTVDPLAQQAYLKASNTDAFDEFGHSVSVDGDTIVVGARGESSSATGVNGDQGDNSAPAAGAAYVFVRNGTTWSQEAYLKASNTDERDHFGTSVAVWNDTVAIGSIWESSGATGVNGTQGNGIPYSGAAYVFRRVGAAWSQLAYLKASNTDAHDELGQSVSVSGDLVVVGARYEKSSATGVNGDQGDNGSTKAGAAYVFVVNPGAAFCPGDPGIGTPCPCVNDNDGSAPGSGCANGVFASGAQLTGSGIASVSSDTLVLRTTHLEPGNSGLYFQADNDRSPGIVWGDGLRCAGGSLRRLEVRFADASGTSHTTVRVSTKAGNVTAGGTKYYQCWYRTTVNPPCGLGVNDFNTSNGYAIQWRP